VNTETSGTLVLLEPSEAARLLGISSSGIRYLTRAGKLPIAATTSRNVRMYRREDIDRLASQYRTDQGSVRSQHALKTWPLSKCRTR
jgi:hypothetical protein